MAIDLNKLYLLEKVKCIEDPIYPIEAHMKTYNAFEKKMVPFKLFPKQKELLESYDVNRHNLVMKYRQAGISTVTQAYCASKLTFADKDSPETIVVIANKLKTAKKFTKGIADYIKQLPDRFFPINEDGKKMVFTRESQELSEMFNGSQLVSLSTSPDALRGYTPTMLILDEAAFIEGGQTFWSACLASLSTGGKAFLISTPNGQDEIYYKIYESTIAGADNDFVIINMSWWQDPRYNKNIRFIKTDDIVDWLQLPQHEKAEFEEITMNDVNWSHISDDDIKRVREKISEGYIPISLWYEKMAAGMNYEKRKINQELEVSFIGSGDNVIDDKTIMEQERKNVKDPEYKQMKGLMWIWKEPEEDHRYILACLPPNEKVMTDSGLKNIQDVNLTDKLINKDGDLVNIKNKQTYPVKNEDIFEFGMDNTFRKTRFTGEHPIFVSNANLKRNYKKNHEVYNFNERYWDFNFDFKPAKDVNIGNWVKVPNTYKKIINPNPKLWENYNDVRVDFKVNNPLNNSDFWWFVGLWLGDGFCVKGKKNKYSYTINITLNSKETDYLNRLIYVINTVFGREPSIVNRNNVTLVTFNSKVLFNFLTDNFNSGAINKIIPEWAKYIEHDLKYHLVLGYLNSDGSVIPNKRQHRHYIKMAFVSISLELLEGFQDILFSLGLISSLNLLRKEQTYKFNNCTGIQKETYNLTLSNYDTLKFFQYFNYDEYKLNKLVYNHETTNKRIIKNCHLSSDTEYIYFRVRTINKTKHTGLVYNFECETNTFMCHHITTHNCDVSRGDSDDKTGMVIIDYDTWEQVAEYYGHIPPDKSAQMAYDYGKLYNAFIVIDLTGMGVATGRKLRELNYPNKMMYWEGLTEQEIFQGPEDAKTPGLNFARGNVRNLIIDALEHGVRTGFVVRSQRLINEAKKFIYKNGRADHSNGSHDDLLIPLGMALYIANEHFKKLEKSKAATKSLLNNWKKITSETKTLVPNSNNFSNIYDQKPFESMDIKINQDATRPLMNFNNSKRSDPRNYNWLFGVNQKHIDEYNAKNKKK